MGKFIDRALQLLSEGKTDALQKELYRLEGDWLFLNKVRCSLEENNEDLVEQNNKLKLAAQEILQEKRRIIADSDMVRTGLQQQMTNIQVSKSAELEELVTTNIKLQREIRALKKQRKQ